MNEAFSARGRTLQEVVAKATAAATIVEVARILIHEGSDALGATMGAVWLLDDSQAMLELLDWIGIDPGRRFRRVPLTGDSPMALAVRTGRPVWLGNRAEYVAAFPQSNTRVNAISPDTEIAAACLPITFEHRPIGGIVFGFQTEHEFADDERAFIIAVAEACAHAMEKIRMVETVQRLYQAEAEARRQAEDARQAAEEANRAKDEFLAMLGHELRNPLAPIVTALELMKLRGDGCVREREIAERQAHYLVRLVDDLLDVSRIARGSVHLRREHTVLADAIAHAVEAANPLIAERQHRLSVEIPPEIAVDADHARLVQVISNLLTNAAKYTPPGGYVTVRARLDGDCARITVTDNGIGIPETLLPKVFDMFVQGPRTSRARTGGLGLGLTIVKSLVELHGGRVEAASEGPGCGTEITVWWPVSTRAMPDAERVPLAAPQLPMRILVVDDNVDAAATMGELLRALGHDVTVANDARTAVAAAREHAPQVALVDIAMPDCDGYELAIALQRVGPMVLLAVSGYGRPADRERAMEVGFSDYLVKPLSLDDVRAALGAVRLS